MTYTYRPKGVCSRLFEIELERGVIRDVRISGGCDGNLQGIAGLLRGADARDTIGRLKGIRCEKKATSCPDQIAIALEAALAQEKGEGGEQNAE